MKKVVLSTTLLLLFFSLFSQKSTADFVITINTLNPGLTGSSSIKLNFDTAYNYNYTVDWNNDGIFDQGNITNEVIHLYSTSGLKTLRIKGLYPKPIFIDDKDKLVSIDQWGSNPWSDLTNSFRECDSLLTTPLDTPNFSQLTSLANTFYGCELFDGAVNHWDISNVESIIYMFGQCPQFNQPVNNWNVSNVELMIGTFAGATSFNQPVDNWNTNRLKLSMATFQDAQNFNQNIGNWKLDSISTNFGITDIISNSDISQNNYDNILIAWQAKPHPNNLTFRAQNMQYCKSDSARNLLINNDGWVFSLDNLAPGCLVSLKDNLPSLKNEVKIYPNPTFGGYSIDLGNKFETVKFSIFDASGRIVQKNSYHNQKVLQLSLNKPSGIYFIELQLDNKTHAFKLLKN